MFIQQHQRRIVILHLVLIASVMVLTVMVVNPFRSVLLGDDAIYVKAVQRLVTEGKFKLPPGATASLVFQILWAGLFTAPFRFSISAVVLSVLPLAVLGLSAYYGTILEFGHSKTVALMGTLTIVTSPLFIRLLPTFMTDVPFVSLMLIAIYCYVRGIKRNHCKFLIIGSVATTFSLLTRQTGLAIMIGISVALIHDQIREHKISWKKFAAALTLPTFVLIAYSWWLYGMNGLTWAQKYVIIVPTRQNIESASFPLHFIRNFTNSIAFTSLLVAPFLLMRRDKIVRALVDSFTKWRRVTVIFFSVTLILGLNLALGWGQLSYVPGVLYWMGLRLLQNVWPAIAILSLVFTLTLLLSQFERFRWVANPGNSSSATFFVLLLLCVCVVLISILPDAQQTDRYLLPLLPLVGLVILGETRFRPKKGIAITVMAFSLVWSAWTTRFWYDVAQVQWNEAERLVASGVAREDIRGNWAWEGWHFWDRCLDAAAMSGAVDASYNDCWHSKAETQYKVKLYSILDKSITSSTEGYEIERLIPIRTFGIPARVGVFYNAKAQNPKSISNGRAVVSSRDFENQ